MENRGAGITSGQLAALPDGALYLVANGKMAAYCRALLVHLGRRHNALVFVTPDSLERECGGRRWGTVWDYDHALTQVAGRSVGMRAVDLMRAYFPPRE